MTTTEFLLLNLTSIKETYNKSEIPKNPTEFNYFAAFLIIVLSIVGLSGNALTVFALWKYPRARGPTANFIISLCVADFLYCAWNLPFTVSEYIIQKWIYGDIFCILYPFVQYVNSALSLLLVTAVTINRYILIAHKNVYENIYQRRYIGLMIVVIWLFTFSLLVPTLAGVWGRFGYDEKLLACSIVEVNGQSPKAFLFIIGFIIPTFTIIFCYARIFWVVKRSSKRLRNHSKGEVKEQKNRDTKKRKEEWRLTRMILIIFCSFILCFLPQTVIKVTDKNVRYPVLHTLGYILIYTSSCINPIIYGVTNKQYREAYKSVLCRTRPKRTSVLYNVSPSNENSSSQSPPHSNISQSTKGSEINEQV